MNLTELESDDLEIPEALKAKQLSKYEAWLFERAVESCFLLRPRGHLWESLARLEHWEPVTDWESQLRDLLDKYELLSGFLFSDSPRFVFEFSAIAELLLLIAELPYCEYGITGYDLRFLVVESEHGTFFVASHSSGSSFHGESE